MTSPASSEKMIASLIYKDGVYPGQLLEEAVRWLQEEGFRVAGVIQHDLARNDRSKCDMKLEDLASGKMIDLSEDRGDAAQGCRIDQQGLAEAAALIETSLQVGDVDLLVINKFGKIESEGGGLRDMVADAVMLGIPAIIGVPMRNIDAWNMFAGELHESIELERQALLDWIAVRLKRGDGMQSERLRQNHVRSEHADDRNAAVSMLDEK